MGIYVYGDGQLVFSDKAKALEAINNMPQPKHSCARTVYDSLEDAMTDFGFSGEDFSHFETWYDHTDELLPVIRPFLEKISSYEFHCDDEHNYWSWNFDCDKGDINYGNIYYDNDPYAIEHFIKQATPEMLKKALAEKLLIAAQSDYTDTKSKWTALLEFIHVLPLKFECDEAKEDPCDIVRKMLDNPMCKLHADFVKADTVNVSFIEPDGSESEWCEL